eukprot:12150513-Alexandrium_andersonii.AAC.1
MAPSLRSMNCRGQGAASMCPPCKASSAGFGTMLCAEFDGDDETGRRANRTRFWGGGVRGGRSPTRI